MLHLHLKLPFKVRVEGTNPDRMKWCYKKLNNYIDWWVTRDLRYYPNDKQGDGIYHLYSFDDKEIATEFLITWNGAWA